MPHTFRTTLAGAFTLISTAAIAQEGPLVTTDWLEANLQNPAVRLSEVSVNPGVFERGHIPGATNFVRHTGLVDPVHRDIASQEQLQGLLHGAGVNEDSTIILYGDTNNWFAACGAWVLDVYGVQNVKLLDDGRKLWEAEGRQLATSAAALEAGKITLKAANADLRALLPEVVAASNAGSHTLVDIRSNDEIPARSSPPRASKKPPYARAISPARSMCPVVRHWPRTAALNPQKS